MTGMDKGLLVSFVDHLADSVFTYNTDLKTYRLRLRTFFKFVRNPHAHHKLFLRRNMPSH